MADDPLQPLLVELFVEELPPKTLERLSQAFAEGIAASLRTQGLADDGAAAAPFATPRRLAVRIDAVRARAADRAVSHKLMPASVGLDASGAATPALLKRLAALGADAAAVAGLQRRLDGKSETLFLEGTATGASLVDGLQRALDQALAQLPIAKVMQYQLDDGWTSVGFVRPAHGLVALHGADVVPVQALGLEAGRATLGHRFEARSTPIVLASADSYEQQLADEGAVIAGFAKRRAEIARQLQEASAAQGAAPIDDDALLDEVTALVERPNVLACRFDEAFLAVPAECLVLTMKANQKYFPLVDGGGRLTNRFLVVSNITPASPSRVIEGNERVVRPRLADAKFFFDQDRKKTLESRVPALDKVVYHGKLGSQGERVARVRTIAAAIVRRLGKGELAAAVDCAAHLAKADLTTDMVGEFPELQGVMGRYYALADGESEQVANAIEDHYKPRFAGDALPRSEVGVVVALADKLETVVGLFGVGQRPSGDKDPFGLRRHALGIVRLLIEKELRLKLSPLLDDAHAAMPEQARGDWLAPLEFIKERARGYFEEQGFDRRAINSVLVPHGDFMALAELLPMVREAARFLDSDEGALLAAANKRITNILKKSGVDLQFGLTPRALRKVPDPRIFQQEEEHAVLAGLHTAGEASLQLREQHRYAESLAALLPLSAPTAAFFDKVMVNVDDPVVRDNRITLLQHARAYMNLVADLTLMAG